MGIAFTRAVVECRNRAAMVPSLWPVIANREAKVCRRSCQVAHSIPAFSTARLFPDLKKGGNGYGDGRWFW